MENRTLTKHEEKILRRYCRGCIYFNSQVELSDICSIIEKLYKHSLERVSKWASNCPCRKCIVKVTCTGLDCKEWESYVKKEVLENKPNTPKKKVNLI